MLLMGCMLGCRRWAQKDCIKQGPFRWRFPRQMPLGRRGGNNNIHRKASLHDNSMACNPAQHAPALNVASGDACTCSLLPGFDCVKRGPVHLSAATGA